MISKAWATIRRARSFLPLLRPFIMRLGTRLTRPTSWRGFCEPVPVHQSLDNGHLGLLELFLGITTSCMREVDGVVDLDVVVEGDIFYFNSETKISVATGFRAIPQDAPVGLPLPKELDLLAELGDIFR